MVKVVYNNYRRFAESLMKNSTSSENDEKNEKIKKKKLKYIHTRICTMVREEKGNEMEIT